MKTLLTMLAGLPLLTLAAVVYAKPGAPADARTKAAGILETALKAARTAPADEAVAALRPALTEAEALLAGSHAAGELAAAREELASQPAKLADIRKRLTRLQQDLAFTPVREAELPEGFPPAGPVGEVIVKQYPAYRMAQTATTGNRAFWTLFSHIKKKEIPMTAPVEMTYEKPAARLEEKNMAFLYGGPGVGAVGADGNVEVRDVPAMTVVSIGVRGLRSEDKLAEAERRLTAWLEEQKANYAADGPVRVFGYNSPFVTRDRQYYEVQIPIRPLAR